MTLSTKLQSIDLLRYKHVNRLHFNSKKGSSTACGGCCTLLCILGFIAFAWIQWLPIYRRKNPEITSVYMKNPQYHSVDLKDIGQVAISIRSMLQAFKPDPTKINIELVSITNVFNKKGEFVSGKESKAYDFEPCNQNSNLRLDNLTFNVVKAAQIYCVKDPNNELNMVRAYSTNTFTSFEIRVNQCLGAGCSTKTEIDEWLSDKYISIWGVQQGVHMSSYDEFLSHEIHQFDSLKLQTDYLQISKIQMSINKFIHNDDQYFGNIISYKNEETLFSTINYLPTQRYEKKKSFDQLSSADRLKLDRQLLNLDISYSDQQKIVERKVKNIKDWISLIAGIPNLLILIAYTLLADFLNFVQQLEIFTSFQDPVVSGQDDKLKKQMTKKKNRDAIITFAYLKCPRLRCFFKCFLRKNYLKKRREDVKQYQELEKMIARQFDIKRVIYHNLKVSNNQKRILKKLQMQPCNRTLLSIMKEEERGDPPDDQAIDEPVQTQQLFIEQKIEVDNEDNVEQISEGNLNKSQVRQKEIHQNKMQCEWLEWPTHREHE